MITQLKRTILALTMIVCALMSTIAQDFQGYATYQSSRKMGNFSFKGDGMTPAMQEQLEAQMKKQFQKEYTLKFNLTESIWKEVESLDNKGGVASAGGMVVSISAGEGPTYKNTVEKLYLKETDLFTKPFLISDELITREWEITSETKEIGNYLATKAIFTEVRESRSISFNSDGGEDSSNEEVKMDTIKVEAWFAPQIPVSHGPENHWGLPGLILEVDNGNTKFLCTKIVLNPEEGVEITRPKKGKKVTRAEFAEESQAKSREMMDKFKKGGKGEGYSITIGGGRD